MLDNGDIAWCWPDQQIIAIGGFKGEDDTMEIDNQKGD